MRCRPLGDTWRSMNHEFILGEKLQRAVSFRVNGVSKLAVNGWKDGDDRAAFMVVRYTVDLFANRKFCHRDPLRIIGAIISPRMSERF